MTLTFPTRRPRPPRPSATSRGYNGFTGRQRDSLGRSMSRYLSRHPGRKRKTCDVCSNPAVHWHLEDYYDFENPIAVCLLCHVAIHDRFGRDAQWDRYRSAIARGAVFRPVTSWQQGLKGIYWSDEAYQTATHGPSRGRGILDEIATGRWLNAGRS